MDEREELEALRRQVAVLSARAESLEAELNRVRSEAAKYRAVFHGVPTALAMTDAEGRFVDVNASFVRLLGYPLDDLRERHISSISDEAEQAAEIAAFRDVVDGVREHVEMEKRYLCRDGSWLQAHMCASYLFDGENHIAGAYAQIAAVQDEDEVVSSTVSVRAIGTRNRAMLDAVPDLLFLIGDDGKILDCKPSPIVPITKPVECYVGRRIEDVFPAGVAGRHAALVVEVATTGEHRSDVYAVAGENRFEEAFFARTRTKNVVVAIRDVTRRALAEKERDRLASEVAAQVSELRQWKALADRAPDAIVLLSLSGVVQYANPAFGVIIDSWPIIGTNIARSLARSDELAQVERQLREVSHFRGDLALMRADGSEIVVYAVVFVIADGRNQPTALGGILRDRTDELRAEVERDRLNEELVEGQARLIRELETPLLPVAPGVLVMPLVGRIDARRAERILSGLLDGVVKHGARMVILDITGVSVVDDEVALGLVRAARAVRLLGADTVLTGVGPAVAQQLVAFADEVSVLKPCSTLERGVALALGGSRGDKRRA